MSGVCQKKADFSGNPGLGGFYQLLCDLEQIREN